MTLTPTQQAKAEEAAKAYAKSYGRKEIGYYTLNFSAGVSWATREIVPEVLVEFAEWMARDDGEEGIELVDGEYYWKSDKDGDQPIPTTELVNFFITYKNRRENEQHPSPNT